MAAGYDEICRMIREQEPPKPSTRLSTLSAADLTKVAAQRRAPPEKLARLVRETRYHLHGAGGAAIALPQGVVVDEVKRPANRGCQRRVNRGSSIGTRSWYSAYFSPSALRRSRHRSPRILRTGCGRC